MLSPLLKMRKHVSSTAGSVPGKQRLERHPGCQVLRPIATFLFYWNILLVGKRAGTKLRIRHKLTRAKRKKSANLAAAATFQSECFPSFLHFLKFAILSMQEIIINDNNKARLKISSSHSDLVSKFL